MSVCGECKNYCAGDSYCSIELPQWVETQGQSAYVSKNEPAHNCNYFIPLVEVQDERN